MPSPARHQCLIYEGSPSRNLPSLVAVIKNKLEEKQRCLYLDSPAMVAGMRSYLAATGVDVLRETERGALVLSSDQGHLVAGEFDVEGMMRTLQDAVEQAIGDGYNGLWASGDMTWEFGPRRDFARLVEYECRLEEFIRHHPSLSGICIYHGDTLPREALLDGLLTHQSLFVNQTLSRINPHYIPPGKPKLPVRSADLDRTLDDLYRGQSCAQS